MSSSMMFSMYTVNSWLNIYIQHWKVYTIWYLSTIYIGSVKSLALENCNILSDTEQYIHKNKKYIFEVKETVIEFIVTPQI